MRDLVHVAAKAYTRPQICDMEITILTALNYEVWVATAVCKHFMAAPACDAPLV